MKRMTILNVSLIIVFLFSFSISIVASDDQTPVNPHKERQKVVDLNLKIMDEKQALLATDLITEYYDYLCITPTVSILKNQKCIHEYLEILVNKYSRNGLKILHADAVLQKEKSTCELRVVVEYEYEDGKAYMVYYIHRMKQVDPNCDELDLEKIKNNAVIKAC